MESMLKVHVLELLGMALAGFILGASFMYGVVSLPTGESWRTINAGLIGLGQFLIILAILRSVFARARLAASEPDEDR